MQPLAVGPGRTKVGFIGTGIMGAPMAGHVLSAGYELWVHNRTREKAAALLARGATWCDSAAGVARACDVVVTIIGYPRDVEQVYLGEAGLVQSARSGTFLVDMTTSDPELAERIEREGRARGLACIDAPVTGGDAGARNAELSIMAGGDEAAFRALEPLFRCFGSAVLQGPAGSGQHAKLANQIAIAGTMLGVCESLAYARRAGLDPEKLLQSISRGAAGSTLLARLGPRMLAGDFAPGFYVKHFMKDMDLALSQARGFGLDARGLALARALYGELDATGHGDAGTQSLFRWYER
ncbi:MAG TPA: NAD(P)-dependent oxidoreductase [Polyangiaceae bacterium]